MSLLEFSQVTAGYGEIVVLQEVSVAINPGEIVAIIGPNGAGKSTVLKTSLGYLKPKAGRVTFDGEDVTGLPTFQVVRRGMGYVPQGRIVFHNMTVEENLELGGFPIQKDRARIKRNLDKVYTLFPRLAERRSQRAGTMSGGEQQMLAIGRALMPDPKIVLMDEPSLGLSPKFVKIVFEKIIELKQQLGMTMMIVEQNAAQALQLCDRAYVLELGRNKFTGGGLELLADPRVRAMYLGG